jgi:hypothetical protein
MLRLPGRKKEHCYHNGRRFILCKEQWASFEVEGALNIPPLAAVSIDKSVGVANTSASSVYDMKCSLNRF